MLPVPLLGGIPYAGVPGMAQMLAEFGVDSDNVDVAVYDPEKRRQFSSNDLMLELWPGELDDVDEEPGFREATSGSETLAARLLIGLANAGDELLREADRLLDLAAASLNVEAHDA